MKKSGPPFRLNYHQETFPPIRPKLPVSTSSPVPGSSAASPMSTSPKTVPNDDLKETSTGTIVSTCPSSGTMVNPAVASRADGGNSNVPVMIVNPLQYQKPRTETVSSASVVTTVASSNNVSSSASIPVSVEQNSNQQGGALSGHVGVPVQQGFIQTGGNILHSTVFPNNFVLGNPFIPSDQLTGSNFVFGSSPQQFLFQGNLLQGNYLQTPTGNFVQNNLLQGNVIPSSLVHGGLMQGNLLQGSMVSENLAQRSFNQAFSIPSGLVQMNPFNVSMSGTPVIVTSAIQPNTTVSTSASAVLSSRKVISGTPVRPTPTPPRLQNFQFVIEPDPEFDEKMKKAKLVQSHASTSLQSGAGRVVSDWSSASPSLQPSASRVVSDQSSQYGTEEITEEESFVPKITDCYSMKKFSLTQMMNLLNEKTDMLSFFKKGTRNYFRAEVFCKAAKKFNVTGLSSVMVDEFYDNLISPYITVGEVLLLKKHVRAFKKASKTELEKSSSVPKLIDKSIVLNSERKPEDLSNNPNKSDTKDYSFDRQMLQWKTESIKSLNPDLMRYLNDESNEANEKTSDENYLSSRAIPYSIGIQIDLTKEQGKGETLQKSQVKKNTEKFQNNEISASCASDQNDRSIGSLNETEPERIRRAFTMKVNVDNMQKVNADNMQKLNVENMQKVNVENMRKVNADNMQKGNVDNMQKVNVNNMRKVNADNMRKVNVDNTSHTSAERTLQIDEAEMIRKAFTLPRLVSEQKSDKFQPNIESTGFSQWRPQADKVQKPAISQSSLQPVDAPKKTGSLADHTTQFWRRKVEEQDQLIQEMHMVWTQKITKCGDDQLKGSEMRADKQGDTNNKNKGSVADSILHIDSDDEIDKQVKLKQSCTQKVRTEDKPDDTRNESLDVRKQKEKLNSITAECTKAGHNDSKSHQGQGRPRKMEKESDEIVMDSVETVKQGLDGKALETDHEKIEDNKSEKMVMKNKGLYVNNQNSYKTIIKKTGETNLNEIAKEGNQSCNAMPRKRGRPMKNKPIADDRPERSLSDRSKQEEIRKIKNGRESCNKSNETKSADNEDIEAKITETGSVTDEEELEIGDDDHDEELVLDLTAESGSDGDSVVLEEEEEKIKKMAECEVTQTTLLSKRWKLSNILANCEPEIQKSVKAAKPVATVEAVDKFMSDSEQDSSDILKVCYLCGLKFLNMNQMWYHLVDKHAKVQPTSSLGQNFLCSHCYKSFSSVMEVRKHELEIHLSDYPCYFCGLSLHNRWGMIKHIASMHSELYQCHICDGQFLGEKNFRIHMWTVHDGSNRQDEKRAMYVCLFCNVKHAYKRNLRVHLHNAHMQMPFVYSKECLCVSCRHTFLDKDALFFHRSENACFAEKIHQLNPASLSSLVNEVVSLQQSQKTDNTVLKRKKYFKKPKESDEKTKSTVTIMLAEEFERKKRFRSLFEKAESEPCRNTREVVVNGKKLMYPYLEFVTRLNMDGHIEAEDLPIVVDTLVKFILLQFPNMSLDGDKNNLYDLAVSLSRTPIYTSVLELFGYGPLPLDNTLKKNVAAFLYKLENHSHFKKSLCNGENIPEALKVMLWCLKTTLEAWKQSEKCSGLRLAAVTANFQTMCPSENSQLVVVESFLDITKEKLKNLIEFHKSDVRFLSALANNEFTSRLCDYMEVTCTVLTNCTIGITISEHGMLGNKLLLPNLGTILPAVIPAVSVSSYAGLAQQLPVMPGSVITVPISAIQATETGSQASLEKNKNDKTNDVLMVSQQIEGTEKLKDMPKIMNQMPKSSVQTATSFAAQNPLLLQMPQLAAPKSAMSLPTCVALHQQQKVLPSLLPMPRSVTATQVSSASVVASTINKPLILPKTMMQIPAQARLAPIGLATPQQPQLLPKTMMQIPRFTPQTLIISTSGGFSATEGPQYLSSSVMQMTSSTSQTLVKTTASFLPDLASLKTGAPLQFIQPKPQPDFIMIQNFQNTGNEQNSDQTQNTELNRKIAVNNQLKSMLQLKKSLSSWKGMQIAQKTAVSNQLKSMLELKKSLSSMKGMQIAQKYRTRTLRTDMKYRGRKKGSYRKTKPEEPKCDKNLRKRKPSVKYTLDDYTWDESEEEEIIPSPEESGESDDEWRPHNWKSESDGDASENIEGVDSSDTSDLDLDEISEYLGRDTQTTKHSEGDAKVNQTVVSVDNEKTMTEKSTGPDIKSSRVETEVNQTELVKMNSDKATAEKSEVVNTDENTLENDTTVITIDGDTDETNVKRSEVVIEKMRIFLKNKVKTNETNSENLEEKHVTIDLTTPEHSVDKGTMSKETEVTTDELITENSVDKESMFKESKMTTDGIRAEQSKDVLQKDNSFMKHVQETVEREINESNVQVSSKSRWALKQYLDNSMMSNKSESLKRVALDDSVDDKPRKVVKIENSPSCLKSCSKTSPWWDSYVKCCYVKLERNEQVEKLASGGSLRSPNTKDYTDRKMTRHFVKQICTDNFITEMGKVVSKNETRHKSKGFEDANENTLKSESGSPKKRGRPKRLYTENECNKSVDNGEQCDIPVSEIVQERNKPIMVQTDEIENEAENENLDVRRKQKEILNSITTECTKAGHDDSKSHQGEGRTRKIGKETDEVVRESVETVKQDLDGKALETEQETIEDNKSESMFMKNKGLYVNNQNSYKTIIKKTGETNLKEIAKEGNQSCNAMPRKRGRPRKNKPIADDRPERSLSDRSKHEEIRSGRKNENTELVNKSVNDQNNAKKDESNSGRKFLRPRKKCNYMEDNCSDSSVTEDEDSATDSDWVTTAKKRRENSGSSNKGTMNEDEDDILKSNKVDDNEEQNLKMTSECEQTHQAPVMNFSVNRGNALREQYNDKQNVSKQCAKPIQQYVRQIDRAVSFVIKSENDMEEMFEETQIMPSKMTEFSVRVKTEPLDLEFSGFEYGGNTSNDQLCQKAVENQRTMVGADINQSKTNANIDELLPVKQELAHQSWPSAVPVTLFTGNPGNPGRYSIISVGHCVVATLTSSSSSALVTLAASHTGTIVSSAVPVNKSNNIWAIADKCKTQDDGQVQDTSFTRKPNILSRYGQLPTVARPTAKITRHPLMLIPSNSTSPKSSGVNSSPKLIGSVPSKLVSVLNIATTGTLTASAKLFGSVVPNTTTKNSTSTLSSANNLAANSPSPVKSSQVSSCGESKPGAPYTVKSFRDSSGVTRKPVKPGFVAAMKKFVSSASTTSAVSSPKNTSGAKIHSSNKPGIVSKQQNTSVPCPFNCALINIPGTNQFALVQIPLSNSFVQQGPGNQQIQGMQQTGMLQPTMLLSANSQSGMVQPTQLSSNLQTGMVQPTQLFSTIPQCGMVQPTQLSSNLQTSINQQAIQAQYSSNAVTPSGQIMLPIVTPNQSIQTSKSCEQQTANQGQQVLTAPSCIPVVIKSEPPDEEESDNQTEQPPHSNQSPHSTDLSCSGQPTATLQTSNQGQSSALKHDLNTSQSTGINQADYTNNSTVVSQTLQPSLVQTNPSMPQLHIPILQQNSLPFLQSPMFSLSGGSQPVLGLQPDQSIQPNQIMQFQVGMQQSGQSPLALIGQPQVLGMEQSISPGQCGSLPQSGTQIPVGSLLNQQTLMVDQNTPLVPGQFIFVPNSSQAAVISPSVKPGTSRTPGERVMKKSPKKPVSIKPKGSKVEKEAIETEEHNANKDSREAQVPKTLRRLIGGIHKKPPVWSARKEGKLHCIVCQAVFYHPSKLGKHLQEQHREYIMKKIAEKETKKDGAAKEKILKQEKDSQ